MLVDRSQPFELLAVHHKPADVVDAKHFYIAVLAVQADVGQAVCHILLRDFGWPDIRTEPFMVQCLSSGYPPIWINLQQMLQQILKLRRGMLVVRIFHVYASLENLLLDLVLILCFVLKLKWKRSYYQVVEHDATRPHITFLVGFVLEHLRSAIDTLR